MRKLKNIILVVVAVAGCLFGFYNIFQFFGMNIWMNGVFCGAIALAVGVLLALALIVRDLDR